MKLLGIGVVATAVLGIVVVYAGSGEPPPQDDTRLQVASSLYPLHEFVVHVGGDLVDAKLLVSPGADPHDWEPTIQEARLVRSADVIVINGAGFEGWLDGERTIDTSHGVTLRDGDPHIWLNPANAIIQVHNIAAGLGVADPQNAAHYIENAESYMVDLEHLDSGFRRVLDGCSRDFMVAHDAFAYMADEYGLVQHPIVPSTDPRTEPTGRDLEEAISIVGDLDMDIIFTESGRGGAAFVVAAETGAKVMELDALETGGPYIQVMLGNLASLEAALCR